MKAKKTEVLSINKMVTIIFVVLRMFILSNDHFGHCVDLCILVSMDLSVVNMYSKFTFSLQNMGK